MTEPKHQEECDHGVLQWKTQQLYLETDVLGSLGASLLQARDGMWFPRNEALQLWSAVVNRIHKQKLNKWSILLQQ